ncbi:MAG: hydrogenase-4 component E [Deltaproteobacteria bacterium]|nr:hydrogenase-4 component E [Deltaproteobacteria bacterium]
MTTVLVQSLMIGLILANLALLASSRVRSLIVRVAFQGMILGVLPLVAAHGQITTYTWGFSLMVFGLKGIAFPWLLMWTFRRVKPSPEIEPLVGYNLTILAGLAGLLFALWLQGGLPMPDHALSDLAFATAFMTSLTGFLLLVTRKKALTQVIGYLVAENGIFLFGVTLSPHGPLWMELSTLLDLFVAVFVMGIAIHHINREFDSIDMDSLSSLKD